VSVLTKAYNNFLKYEAEKGSRDEQLSTAKASSGLLAPRAKKMTKSSGKKSEMDKVTEYVQLIRKHRKSQQ